MISKFCAALSLAALALCGVACTHTPPGTSVEVALARKPEIIRPAAPAFTPVQAAPQERGQLAPSQPIDSLVDPALPEQDARLNNVTEAYSRATFCLQAGRDAEAIAAFEEVVRLDPQFTDAWSNLAVLYEKTGQEQKAIEAFKKAKKIARQ